MHYQIINADTEKPIYATIRYKTAFAHLSGYAVQDGQQVEAGQLVVYIGTNVSPLDFGALNGAQ